MIELKEFFIHTSSLILIINTVNLLQGLMLNLDADRKNIHSQIMSMNLSSIIARVSDKIKTN